MGDSRQVKKLINDLSGENIMEIKNVHFLPNCGVECPNDSEIANGLNDFLNAGTNISNKSLYIPLQTVFSHDKSMFLHPKSHNEVRKIIDELDKKSSSVLDNISNILVKVSSEITVPYLTYIINLFFLNGKFSGTLAKAKIITLHMNSDKTDENSYRPMSLFITGSKISEKIM